MQAIRQLDILKENNYFELELLKRAELRIELLNYQQCDATVGPDGLQQLA